jgi:DNA-binding response OmpR family regulator
MAVVSPVLVAEDDVNDQQLLRMAFERAGIRHPMVMVQDGAQAIEYLSDVPTQHPLPCFLLTDLKMPRVDGFDLLKWIQSQDRFQNLPIIVLSASCHESDMQRTLGMGAREYFVKPSDFRGLIALVKQLHAAWIKPHCGEKERAAQG